MMCAKFETVRKAIKEGMMISRAVVVLCLGGGVVVSKPPSERSVGRRI
jgi:flagellar biosynthesis protein FliQ